MSHGFAVTSMEDKDVPGIHIETVNDLVDFFFGLLHGELDRTTIRTHALQMCRNKYEDNLRRQAEQYLKVMKVLHVILTKP